MVSKAFIVKAFAAAVIGFFVLELFVVFLYSGNTPPTDANASVTPLASVAPGDLTAGLPGFGGSDANASAVFTGKGQMRGNVTGFERENLLECPSNATKTAEVETFIATIPGVNNTRNYGDGIIGFEAPTNLTASAFSLLAANVQAAAEYGGCPSNESSVYRIATVTLADATVTLTPTTGSGKAQVMTSRAILAYFSQIGRQPFALSPPEVGANQTVTLAVLAQNHGGVLTPAQGDYLNLVVLPIETASQSAVGANATN